MAFAGPSISPAERSSFPEVEWRGPAEAGDLLRLPVRTPVTVCLIDGYFDHRSAVRHQEMPAIMDRPSKSPARLEFEGGSGVGRIAERPLPST